MLTFVFVTLLLLLGAATSERANSRIDSKTLSYDMKLTPKSEKDFALQAVIDKLERSMDRMAAASRESARRQVDLAKSVDRMTTETAKNLKSLISAVQSPCLSPWRYYRGLCLLFVKTWKTWLNAREN